MQVHDVLDVPEDGLPLVEDTRGNMVAELLHLLHKLLFPINQALNQLTKDRRKLICRKIQHRLCY